MAHPTLGLLVRPWTPPRSLGELDTLLTPQVKKMVSHQVPKDLTGASPPDLWRALEKVLPTPVLA